MPTNEKLVKQVVLITGASSGFGKLAAEALAEAGHTIFATLRETTGRNASVVADYAKFAKDHRVNLRTLELDVSSEDSARAAVREIVTQVGRLDIVVHNAGHMTFGPLEAYTPEQIASEYDINVVSTQRINRAALPIMRKQHSGLLIWNSSSSAAGGTPPYLGPYFAAKAGMDALAVAYAKNSRAGASRRASWCRAHSPKGPIISLTRAHRRTKRLSTRTKPDRFMGSAIK